jgi:4a-hydroxytetrahydrobiopterin dehydratase
MPDRTPLAPDDLQRSLASLPGWSEEGDRLVRTFTFASFREAVAFIVRVAFEAEDLDHHPEVTNVYNRVTLALTTHDAGNRVTETDLALARKISALASGGPAA